MKLNARLARLEAAASQQIAATAASTWRADESRARLEANWEIMQSTMSEEHARLVVGAYSVGMQYVTGPDYHSPAGRLLRRCLDAISRYNYAHWPYTLIPADVALAMPPVLAQIYLDHDPLPLHECEQCGMHLPHEYFTTCPLCGGHVGWYAFWQKHKDDEGDRNARGPAVRR